MPTSFDISPPELVDLALHMLHSKGIELIEWQTLLYRRMGIPVILRDYHYLFPDEDLGVASDALLELGLPLSIPSPLLLLKTDGDPYAKGRLHRLTSHRSITRAQHLILYPRSFVGFAQKELSPAPLGEASVLVPHPSAVALESEPSELVGYNLYGLQEGFVNVEDEEVCAWLGVDRRVEEAADVVRTWGRAGAWCEVEEWMGAALEAVVSGTGEDR